jgi:hypothetical protein
MVQPSASASGIKVLTPAQRHAGEVIHILADRHPAYLEVISANLLCWSGETSNWHPIKAVHLARQQQEVDKAA